MADEEIVINVDDEIEHEEGATGASDKNDAVEDLKSQFLSVQEQAKADRERAEAAERRAAQALQEANRARESERTARSEITESQMDTVLSGIAAAQAEAETAQRDFEAAAEAGDFRKQGEAQRRIARAEAKLQRLDEAKADVEVRRTSDTGGTRGNTDNGRESVRGDARQSPTDPVEAFIQTRDSGTQKWLRDHPEQARALILDPNSRQAKKLSAAHADAIAEGYGEGSSKYFEHIESFVGLKKDSPNGQQQNGSGERTRRSSPPAAPVSEASGIGGGSGGSHVKLAPHEARAATDGTVVWNPGNKHPKTGEPIKHGDPLVGQPVGHVEFARRKRALDRSGAYRNFLTEQ